jgi:muconolactone D-isomerase
MEILVWLEFEFPDHVNRDEIVAEERTVATKLCRDGKLLRIWRDPLQKALWTLWKTKDLDELHSIFTALPMLPYFKTVKVHPLASHPIDPG